MTPFHVAIIMDGNGRWASARHLPRVAGHRAGAEAVRRTVEAAPSVGIDTLTLYAFSSDNWKRPSAEVETLMRLFQDYLAREAQRCAENGVRISVIGRRDRLPAGVCRWISKAEDITASAGRLHLRIAVDYSSREAILRAARALVHRPRADSDTFSRLLAMVTGGPAEGPQEPAPDVDLLVRTGGEQRLSDFLLWECSYAELYFTTRMWPEFNKGDLQAAVEEYRRRNRRFGALPAAANA